MSALGEIVRSTRLRHRLSQRALAIRAGVTQSSISRVERGLESPSFERFEQILLAMGERPLLATEAIDHGLDPADVEAGRRLTHGERLREAASWNLVATRLELAGARARLAGHPATRLGG